jgi:hypothetical protein
VGGDPVGEMARVWGEMLEAFEELSVEAEQYLPLDRQRVLVLMHNKGRGKSSGVDVARIAAKSANLWEVRNGEVTKLAIYWSRERALDELGIDPAAL